MVHQNTVSIVFYFQYAIGIPLDFLFVFLSISWSVYFINRITINVRLHKKYLREGNSDNIYMHEVLKNVFMLLINITECSYIQLYILGGFLPDEHLYLSSRPMLPECSLELRHTHIFDINLIIENHFKAFFIALGQTGLLFSLAFTICLMQYLYVRFHSIPLNPFRFIRRFLLFTSLLSVLIIIAGTIPYLILFAKLLEPLIEVAYFLIWCRYTLKFYQTLKWRTREFSVRNPSLVKGSVRSRIKFAVVMCSMGLGTFLFIVGNLIINYFFLASVILYYGSCLFNYIYGLPYYQPFLVTSGQIHALLSAYKIKVYVASFLLDIASFVVISQFFVASVLSFGNFLREKLCLRFKLRPELKKRLLKNQA